MSSSAEIKRRRRESGLCAECGAPARDGRTTCADCARKKYESEKRCLLKKRGGNWQDGRGRPPMYIYTAWRGRSVVTRGTSREVAEFFGMPQKTVVLWASKGFRRRKDGVFFERERIEGR